MSRKPVSLDKLGRRASGSRRTVRKAASRSPATTRRIAVDALSRVEGEGALDLHIQGNEIKDLKFRIFEPPRFFEALLRGRDFSEAPDITARICGICPIAYLLGASLAMEDALATSIPDHVTDLRRLIYCGEWIESHVLHAAMLHAPDFLGLDDALQIAKTNPELVKTALRLKKLGNDILEAVGGRAIHPVNLRVGGFHKTPSADRLRELSRELSWGIKASHDLAVAFGQFPFPDFEYDYTCVSLHHPNEYAINRGRIISNRGLDIAPAAFRDHFGEEHVAHSNALSGYAKKTPSGAPEPYLVGPLARYNNNFAQLSPRAQAAAKAAGLDTTCHNPFKSIVVRLVETLYACEEALRLINDYREPNTCCASLTVRAGTGHGCTEAPRGICYHQYTIDDQGLIENAIIVPPTAQNHRQIEADLRGVVSRNLHLNDADLTWRCEQTIRNYDPCISCATHFLKLTVRRDPA